MPNSFATATHRPTIPGWLILYFALGALYLLPIWSVELLPLLDEPNHLAALFIWHEFDSPAYRLDEYYERAFRVVPYVGYFWLAHGLAHVFGIDVAHRIVLSLYVLAVPAAMIAWSLRLHRTPFLGLLAFPFAYSIVWALGFHPYNLGVAVLLWSLWCLDRCLERLSPGRCLALGLAVAACYLCHPLPLAILGVTTPALALARRASLGKLLAAGMVVAIPCVIVLLQMRTTNSADAAPFEATWFGAKRLLALWPNYAVNSVSGGFDVAVFWVVLACIVGLTIQAVISTLQRRPEQGRVAELGPWLHRHRFVAVALLWSGLYFVVPMHTETPLYWWFVGGRFAPLAAIAWVVVPHVRRPRLAYWPALVAVAVLPLVITARYRQFNERAEPMLRALQQIEPGTPVLALSMMPRTDPAVDQGVYTQLSSWVLARVGGHAPYLFTHPVPFLYRVKRSLPSPPWYRQEEFDAQMVEPYEVVIVRNEARPVFPAAHPEWTRTFREGNWTIYKRRGRREGP